MHSEIRPDQCSIVVPVLNAAGHLPALLGALKALRVMPRRVLFIDSASTDGTPDILRKAGFEVLGIRRAEFGHGRTRNLGLRQCADSEVVVFLTQDAVPQGNDWLTQLLAPMADPGVALSFGRQLPRAGATVVERHARQFNYPATGERTVLADLATRGIKGVFCSNSFAAWRRRPLLDVGGFPEALPMGEDMAAALRLLQHGHARVYAPAACAVHSHDYRWQEELRRYFDIGVLMAVDPGLRQVKLPASGEGLRFLKAEMACVLREGRPDLLLPVLMRTVAKSAGYALGMRHERLPLPWRQRLSMHRAYWSS